MGATLKRVIVCILHTLDGNPTHKHRKALGPLGRPQLTRKIRAWLADMTARYR